ncbi:MAG: fumarylacetoacetate hydrolase family protein [Betaproteobacteria bacterium]|jgi:2-keto-4-pentenoate hydratase/2-oxohepta-3-ene-1,7-dioic acid hydratase in catechol pathway
MKIANFIKGQKECVGLVVGESIIDPLEMLDNSLVTERGYFQDTVSFIKAGDAAIKVANSLIAKVASNASSPAVSQLSSIELIAPIRPSSILCSGSNYKDHNNEKANTPISGKEPEFFIKTSDCVVGPGPHLIYDEKLSKKLDCETELAIIVGKVGRHIPVENALDYVFGYTVINDATVRDLQVRTSPEGFVWYEVGRSKVFDSSAPMGPWIVTADEVGDPQNLRLRTRINGELRQSASTANMIFSCAELIHFFSTNLTLKPGMVIITGTPGGTAWSTDADLGGKWVGGDGSETLIPAKRYCRPGDQIECELEKIGILKNTVITA